MLNCKIYFTSNIYYILEIRPLALHLYVCNANGRVPGRLNLESS